MFKTLASEAKLSKYISLQTLTTKTQECLETILKLILAITKKEGTLAQRHVQLERTSVWLTYVCQAISFLTKVTTSKVFRERMSLLWTCRNACVRQRSFNVRCLNPCGNYFSELYFYFKIY